MALTPAQIDQQRRIVSATQTDVASLLEILSRLAQRRDSFRRLGLSAKIDDAALGPAGTDAASYRAAMASVEAILDLLDAPKAGGGHGEALEGFAR